MVEMAETMKRARAAPVRVANFHQGVRTDLTTPQRVGYAYNADGKSAESAALLAGLRYP